MLKESFPALLFFLAMTILTGLVYPLLVMGLAGLFFPHQAGGSLMVDESGAVRGSTLVGQEFKEARYFHCRPSATTAPYNGAASCGSNLAASNKTFVDAVEERVKLWRRSGLSGAVPVDLVTASASGLDPHLSPSAALAQAPLVAAARRLPVRDVEALVRRRIEPRTLGFLGEPRVNVVLLNSALDKAYGRDSR